MSSALEAVAGGSVVQSQPTSEFGNLLEVPSVLQHFGNYFSEKVVVCDSEKTGLLISHIEGLLYLQRVKK